MNKAEIASMSEVKKDSILITIVKILYPNHEDALNCLSRLLITGQLVQILKEEKPKIGEVPSI